jgi:hypothetical protein
MTSRGSVYAALVRSDDGWEAGIEGACRFLDGDDATPPPAPPRRPTTMPPDTAGLEIDGFNALWIEDYGRAAQLFDDVAAQLGDHPEHRAFWLAFRALALQLLARFGDRAAGHEAEAALAAAATSGARNTFFTRLRLSASRRAATSADIDGSQLDGFFEASDALVDRHGASGPRFERWATGLLEGLRSNDHDTLARSIARFGSEVLGLAAEAPRATSGEPDAIWSLVGPYRELTFEVKMAPTTQRVANDDVEQIESATRAIESTRNHPARGLLIGPWDEADASAIQRLERSRLLNQDLLVEDTEVILALVREYRRGWQDEAAVRLERRRAVEGRVPPLDWLWLVHDIVPDRVAREHLNQVRAT